MLFLEDHLLLKLRSTSGSDLEIPVTISFEESAFGTEKEITVNRYEICSSCKGSKAEPGTETSTCSSCNGSGKVTRLQKTFFGQFQQVSTCSSCEGNGVNIQTKCKNCSGNGRLRNNRKLAVTIPAGIEDNSKIRIRNQGDSGLKKGQEGDLYVSVQVSSHEKFQRMASDIFSTEEINIAQAALGDSIKVSTLDGEIELKIPKGIQSGKKIRLNNKGVVSIGRNNRRGSHIITIIVSIPSELSSEQKDLFEKLKKNHLIQMNNDSLIEISLIIKNEFVEPVSYVFKKFSDYDFVITEDVEFNPDEKETRPKSELVTIKSYLEDDKSLDNKLSSIQGALALIRIVSNVPDLLIKKFIKKTG